MSIPTIAGHRASYVPTSKEDIEPKQNILVTVAIKIYDAIKWLFNKIASLFRKPKIQLSERDIERIQEANDFFHPKKKDIPTHTPVASPRAPRVIPITKKTHRPLPPIENPVMQDFHDTALRFVSGATDAIFEEKVEPALSKAQNGIDQFANGIKFAADVAISVGDKASKPLFEKLKKFKIEEMVRPDLQQLLKWLLKDKDIDEAFVNRLKASEVAIEPFIKWLNEGGFEKEPLSSVYEDFEDKKLDSLFESAMMALVEDKIDSYLQLYKTQLNVKLPELIKEMMHSNGQHISSLVIRRLITLLERAPYTKLFDEAIGMGYDHTKAIIAAEKSKSARIEEEEARIQKCEKMAKQDEKAAKYLENITNFGIDKWKEIVGNDAALKAFKNDPIYTTYDKEQFANQIISILAPKQKIKLPDGSTHEVDGLIYLLNEVIVPEEIQDLIKEAITISKEILTPGTQKLLKGFADHFEKVIYAKVEDLILGEVKKGLRKGINTGLSKLFEKVLTPLLFDSLVAEKGMPAIQKQIVRAMGKKILSSNGEKFIPLFHQLTQLDEDGERKKVVDEILKVLKGEIPSIANYNSLMELEIERLEMCIRHHQTDQKSNHLATTKTAYDAALETIYRHIDLRYGEMLVGLAFDVGEAGGLAKKITKWKSVKEFISKEITAAAHDFRKSPDQIVKTLTETIKENYLQDGEIHKLLFEEPEVPSREEANAKLEKEIQKTADLTHDLFAYGMQQNFFTRHFGSWVVDLSSSNLNRVINRIYMRVFGNPEINENLLARGHLFVLNALEQTSENVETKPIKATRLPTLKPDLVC